MGSRYLTDLDEVCRRTGYNVLELDDWQYRARSSGGFNSGAPNHIMAHHTASPKSMDGWNDANYCTFSADAKPLCNLYLSRVPEIYVCAGGATNTNGSGYDTCGMLSPDTMNSNAIGIEAGNDGVGEKWPDDMLDAYTSLCWELGQAYDIPISRIHSHQEYAPTRKNDPAGPPRYATGSHYWDMNQFRADCKGGTPEPEAEVAAPASLTDKSGDTWVFFRNSRTNELNYKHGGDNAESAGGEVTDGITCALWDDGRIDVWAYTPDGGLWGNQFVSGRPTGWYPLI